VRVPTLHLLQANHGRRVNHKSRVERDVSEKGHTNRPAKPFPPSYEEMKDSHSTGFDPGAPSCLPRCTVDGLYDPEARAATKAALRWRRRRTERVTSTPRIVTNKARITVVCIRLRKCTQTTVEGGTDRKRCTLRNGMQRCVSLGGERERNGTDGRGKGEANCQVLWGSNL
jgi:hypothetical protein